MRTFHKAFKGRTDGEIRTLADTISKDIETGALKLPDISIRNLMESACGAEEVAVALATNSDSGMVRHLNDAVSPVRLSAFSNITNALVQRAGYEAYTAPEFIGDKLVTEETDNEDNVQVNGLAEIDDEAMEVPEGGEIPSVKFGEDFIAVPGSKKRGMRVGLTREMIAFDKTGKLIQHSQTIGRRVGFSKEVRILSVVLGLTNTFVRNGIARNTYVTATDPRINSFTGRTLVDYTDIELAEQGFNDYVDDRTVGEPIAVMPDTLLVPKELEWTAARIKNATEVRSINGTETTIGANLAAGKFGIMSSPYLKWVLVKKGGVSNADAIKTWHYGAPKRAFRYRTIFAFKMEQASAMHDDNFDREVTMQWKATERGVAYVWAPWYMQKNVGA